MNATTRRVLTVLSLGFATVALSGCVTAYVDVPSYLAPGPLPDRLADLSLAGRTDYQLTAGEIDSSYGCTVAYELYDPVANDTESGGKAATVVLAHGFMRDLAAMRDWAALWASHGIRTVVVSFCNSSWLNGRHDRNAVDLVAVADVVLAAGPGPGVVYAGFSAGGLAALLAAAADPRTVAYLGLDPVDSGDLAAGVELDVPSMFLFGEPSSCNADGNMTGHPGRGAADLSFRVPFATHCFFENPYAEACERICGTVGPVETAAAIRETVLSVATAWVAGSARDGRAVSGDNVIDPELLAALEAARRIEPVVHTSE